MTTTDSEAMAYVGYCPKCERMYAASVDKPEYRRDTAKFVAELVRDGSKIERVTCAAVRAATWCDCRSAKKAKQDEQVTLSLEVAP